MLVISIAIFAACNALAEIFAKKYVTDNKKCGEWRLGFWMSLIGTIVAIIIYSLGINESYSNPIETFLDYPLILVQFVLFVCSAILCYKSLKYIEVAKEVSISYGGIIVAALGMIIYGFATDNVEILKEYITLPITMTLFICLGGVILLLALTFSAKEPDNKPDYEQTFGIILCLIAVCCSGVKTLIDDNLLAGNALNSYDYIAAYYSLGVIGMLLSWIIITIKEKKLYNPFNIKENKDAIISNTMMAVGGLAFYSAVSVNEVYANLSNTLVPIIVLIIARKLLLEKVKSEEYIALLILIFSITLLGFEEVGLFS